MANSLIRLVVENRSGCQPIRDELLHDRKSFTEPSTMMSVEACSARRATDRSHKVAHNVIILQHLVAKYKSLCGVIHVGTP